jgi:hypothetical protein
MPSSIRAMNSTKAFMGGHAGRLVGKGRQNAAGTVTT